MSPAETLRPGVLLIHIRHGQTDWNAEERLQGETDVPLNDHGRGQAKRNGSRLADCLARFGRETSDVDWVASPLSRARETMEIVRGEIGLEPTDYRLEERLREVAFGRWRGHTIPELKQIDPDAVRARRRDKWGFLPPGGESYGDLKRRVADWLATLERDSVVVSHGGVYRVLNHLVAGTPTAEAPALPAPQDRIAVFRDGRVELM